MFRGASVQAPVMVHPARGLVGGRPFGILSVTEFGATGDGSTDDTAAIQAALDAGSGQAVEFVPGASYRVSGLTMDAAKVRGIIGNNALILAEGEVVGLKLVGAKADGSASPDVAENQTIALSEFAPFISGLRVTSYDGSYAATGIQLSGTFGARIIGCNLFGLNHGIELININRNVVVANGVIWDCAGTGLYWNGGDCHQANVTGNHVSYCTRAIHLDDCELDNLQVVGNDLEAASSSQNEPVSIIAVEESGQGIESLIFVGNTIEDHIACSGPLMDFTATSLNGVTIANNIFGNAKTGVIRISGGSNYGINDNFFRACAGPVIERISNGNWNRFQVIGNRGDLLTGRFLDISATVASPRIQMINVSSNTMRATSLAEDSFIEIDGCRIHDTILSNNLLEVFPTTPAEFESVRITNPTHMSGILVQSNIFRADEQVRAVKITAAGSVSKCTADDNVSYGATDGTSFDVPGDFTTANNA